MKPQGQVIVIRKKRKGHPPHHGGAWKVAYADFVTAMMAFFLVMWLMAQKQEVKASIGGYFRDPGVFDYQKSKGILPGGTAGVAPDRPPETPRAPDPATLQQEQQALAAAAERIKESLLKVPEFKTLRDQIEFDFW